jgi:hypothetical protein
MAAGWTRILAAGAGGGEGAFVMLMAGREASLVLDDSGTLT